MYYTGSLEGGEVVMAAVTCLIWVSPGAFGLSGARTMARAYSTAPRNRKDSLTNVKYGYEECAQVKQSPVLQL